MLIAFLLLAAVIFVHASAQLHPNVRWSYEGSPDAPDGLVFVDYLQYFDDALARSRDDAVTFLIFTLELPNDSFGAAKARKLSYVLEKSSKAVFSETRSADIESYCLEDIDTRTNEQIYDIMDRQDDEYVRIAQRIYEDTLAQLDSETQEDIQRKVVTHKRSYSVISVTHKDAWESTTDDPDMRAVVADICRMLLFQSEIES